MCKKQFRMSAAILSWRTMLLACGLVVTMLTACGSSDNDEPTGNGVDDLAYLQKRIAAEGALVYGVQVGNDGKDIVSRPVATAAEAQAEFYKLIPGGAAHQGLTTSADNITCQLTAADGKSQGSITYRPSASETIYYCAEVTFSQEVTATTGVSRLRYILYDRWPQDDNGFLTDILEGIKK